MSLQDSFPLRTCHLIMWLILCGKLFCCLITWLISFKNPSVFSLHDSLLARTFLSSDYMTHFVQEAFYTLLQKEVYTKCILSFGIECIILLHDSISAGSFSVISLQFTWLISCKNLTVVSLHTFPARSYSVFYFYVISLHDSFPSRTFLPSHYVTHSLWEAFLSSHYLTHFLQEPFCHLITWLIFYRKLSIILLHDSISAGSFFVISLHGSFPARTFLSSHYMTHFLQEAFYHLGTWLNFCRKLFCNLITQLISSKNLSVVSLHDSFPARSYSVIPLHDSFPAKRFLLSHYTTPFM